MAQTRATKNHKGASGAGGRSDSNRNGGGSTSPSKKTGNGKTQSPVERPRAAQSSGASRSSGSASRGGQVSGQQRMSQDRTGSARAANRGATASSGRSSNFGRSSSSSSSSSNRSSSSTGRSSSNGRVSGRMAPTPPLVRREISGILLMAFGVLLFMGLFFRDSAGFFGDALRALSGGLFGITGWFLPFLVFGQGAYRLLARSGHPLWNRFFNLMLLMMLVSAMFQVGAHPRSFYTNTPFGQLITSFFKEGANTLDALSGQDFMAGGIFGGILGVPLLLLFQKAGAMVVLATLGLVVALIVTRISLVDAARSVARGTAGRLGGMAEAARMRREARHEMYEAQTRLMPELDEYATPPGTATGEYARRNTKTTGSAGVGAKGFGSNGSGVPGSASTGSGAGPYARLEQAVSTAAGLSKTGPQPLRERGSRFLDVAPEPQFEEEDAGEEKGPSMSYPASFVHPDKDMGDLDRKSVV